MKISKISVYYYFFAKIWNSQIFLKTLKLWIIFYLIKNRNYDRIITNWEIRRLNTAVFKKSFENKHFQAYYVRAKTFKKVERIMQNNVKKLWWVKICKKVMQNTVIIKWGLQFDNWWSVT